MNIGKKVILFFLVTSISLLILIVMILQNRIDTTQLQEEKNLISNIKKFQNVLNLNGEFIQNIATQYASLAKFKSLVVNQSNSEEFFDETGFMQNLNLSYMAIFDAKKEFIKGNYYDISSDEILPIPDELKMFFKYEQLDRLINSDNIKYMTLSFEKVLFTIKPITQGKQILGYLFIARTLDSNFLTSISEVIQDYTTLLNSYKKDGFVKVKLFNQEVSYNIERLNESYILSHIKLYDVLNHQNFYIQIQHKRAMYQELISQIKWNLSIFIALFIVVIMSMFVFMNRLFTQRIQYITRKIKQAAQDESLAVKLQVTYNDELSYLCMKLNEMFHDIRLHQSRSLQRERDFLQSVLDTQENIIMITDGTNIESTNRKFNEIFQSKERFFNSIALLDEQVKSNLIAVAKRYKKQDKAAKFKVVDDEHKYFTFDVSQLDIKKYLICMNDVSKLNQQINHLQVKASIDELTGVYNKSTITAMANSWLKQKQFCLMIFDIDYFKKTNDTYGHYIGDCVLRDLSKTVANVMPSEDIIGRFGGEEFVILVNVYTNKYIVQIAERIREVIQNHSFVYDDMRLQVTVSIGCTLCEQDESFTTVYKRADKGLYEAKEGGRNRVVVK